MEMRSLWLVFGIKSSAGLWHNAYLVGLLICVGFDLYFLFLIKNNFEDLPVQRRRFCEFVLGSSRSHSPCASFLPLSSEASSHRVNYWSVPPPKLRSISLLEPVGAVPDGAGGQPAPWGGIHPVTAECALQRPARARWLLTVGFVRGS